MAARLRNEWIWWAAALAVVAALSWVALYGFAWNDYDREVSPAFQLLIAGDVWGFLGALPAYGGSLVLRAPFAGVTAALGGGEVAVYRAVSIPCLLAAAVLAVVLARRLGERGRSRGVRALVLGLFLANPLTLRALEIGHPEELLAAVLAIGAVLAAGGRRTLLAAVLLGLAIASKAWAVLAIGPVLLALPAHRVRALAIAGGVAALVLAPLMLGGSGSTLVAGASRTGEIFTPWQLFWPLGETGHTILGFDGMPKPDGYRLAPGWLSPLTHPAIAALVVPLSLLWARLRARDRLPGGESLLALLALLLLLRCLLDPWNNSYYELPFLLALLSWEALCRPERPPLVALAATAAAWATFQWAPTVASPDAQWAIFLAWSLPMTAWLAREVFAPRAARRARRATRAVYA